MTPQQLLDAANLSGAIDALGQEVKAHPADGRRRTFLFELLCFAGDWDRAERQLDVIGHQSDSAELGAHVYRSVLAAERARARLFEADVMPAFLTEPPAYAALHLEALGQLRKGQAAAARTLLERSEATRPPVRGKLGARPFSSLRDADDRLGPFLEVMQADRYAWVPFEQIQRLEIAPPKLLRDLLWSVARLECRGGLRGEVHIPVLYPGTSRHSDDRVRLGRMTDWVDEGDGLTRGAGQRLLLVDDEEQGLLETRIIEFEAA